MNFNGLIIGIVAFLIIGISHPIVIKTEYYVGKKAWPIFLLVGLVLIAISIFVHALIPSIILGIAGFTSLWAIHELIEQEERVAKGWFPANPNKLKK